MNNAQTRDWIMWYVEREIDERFRGYRVDHNLKSQIQHTIDVLVKSISNAIYFDCPNINVDWTGSSHFKLFWSK